MRQILPSPQIVNDVVLYDVLIDVKNEGRQLMSGMTAQVFFIFGKAENATIIPAEALTRPVPKEDGELGKAYRVAVMTETGREQRVIHIGLQTRTQAEVKAGSSRRARPGQSSGGFCRRKPIRRALTLHASTEAAVMKTAILELGDIHKHYANGDTTVRALDGVSLTIHRGEFVAIMGQSGSGKSTLMNIIGCLDRPTSGSYLVLGKEAAHLSPDELAAPVRNFGLFSSAITFWPPLQQERMSRFRRSMPGCRNTNERSAPVGYCSDWGWATALIIVPRNFPVGSNSGWR